MGQKTHPRGFRLALTKKWDSVWFSPKNSFRFKLVEDYKLRQHLMKRSCCVGVASILIKRTEDKIEVTFLTARPGLIIGKKGAEVELIKADIKKFTGKEAWIEVQELKRPDLNAALVAKNIANQIQKRVSWRKAIKNAVQNTMDSGAAGIKAAVSGRLGGAEIARTESYKDGTTPLHTLRINIDYAEERAETTYGTIGIKVWINAGDQSKIRKGAKS